MQSSARRERRTDRNPIPPDAVSGRPAGQIKRRIHGLTALADLEMDAAIRAFGAPGPGKPWIVVGHVNELVPGLEG